MPSRASKTYGTVSADRRKQMTGLEFVQGSPTAPCRSTRSPRRWATMSAKRRAGASSSPRCPSGIHLNPAGTVHGGFTATLLDSCMGLALQTTLEKGLAQTTLEFKISLLRAITPDTGPIRAEGIVLSRGRRVGTAEGRVTDSDGRLLAHGTTTCLIFENSWR